MFPEFFRHKMKEVRSFFEIVRGKVAGNKKQRIQSADEAIRAVDQVKQDYLNEKQQALNQKQPQAGQEKVLRESGGQDISAI